MWESLKQKLRVTKPPAPPQPIPTLAHLTHFETSLGIRLPESYKLFVTTFGAGEIGGYFNIFAPGYPNKPSGSIEGLISLVRDPAVREAFIEAYKDVDFLDRMIPFSNSIGGDIIAWDPDDVRDSVNSEYGIYILPDDLDQIVELASSFKEYIENVCLGDAFKKFAGPKWTTIHEFMPFGRREDIVD